jgi:hypothetical protein
MFVQIELVVDRIRFEHGVKRVLVVMPTGYLRRVIRNSVRKNRDNRLLLTTEDDQACCNHDYSQRIYV